MVFRTKKFRNTNRESGTAAAETIAALENLEKLIAESLASGDLIEGSPTHLMYKREVQKTRNSINLNRRRTP